MKSIVLTLLLTVTTLSLCAQHQALSFEKADELGISRKQLDSLYQSAVNVDSTQAVFNTTESNKSFISNYYQMLKDIGAFLREKGLIWKENVSLFHRVYFAPDGSIDYYLYTFRGDKSTRPPTQDIELYDRLMKEFVAQYNIGKQADKKFVQCGKVTFGK